MGSRTPSRARERAMDLGDFSAEWKPEIVTRNEGVTPEEQYLQRLCDSSFLSLWSYAGPSRDQKADGKGDGKELCDLLVVSGDDVLIFSDKAYKFPDTGNIKLDWSRWFKRAIQKSAEQAWGAGRWLKEHPDRIFLDPGCTQKFPIDLPPPERMRIHYIVVAHNISARCAKHFPSSSGSLMFDSLLPAKPHLQDQDKIEPFVVGWMDPDRPFVHVLDDESLTILLDARDTVTDFVEYLRWKEAFLGSAKERNIKVLYCGEEDLLANYLLTFNGTQHGLVLPDEPIDLVFIEEGRWKDFLASEQRSAQVKADKESYFWDHLIERFCRNILAGTSYDRVTPLITEREPAVRFLALETRFHRRVLAVRLLKALRETASDVRAVRVTAPEGRDGTYFCFLLLPRHTLPEEFYRRARGEQLEALLRITKLVFPKALDIVGVATESGDDFSNRSEDLMYLDARGWTAEEQEHAKEMQKHFKFLIDIKMKSAKEHEFPIELPRRPAGSSQTFHPGKNPRNKLCGCGSGKKYKKCHGA
jgi:SEC-C motif